MHAAHPRAPAREPSWPASKPIRRHPRPGTTEDTSGLGRPPSVPHTGQDERMLTDRYPEWAAKVWLPADSRQVAPAAMACRHGRIVLGGIPTDSAPVSRSPVR